MNPTLEKMGKEFIQLTGNDDNALEFNKGWSRCHNVANIAPKLCSNFQKFSKSDDKNEIEEAKKLDKVTTYSSRNVC